LNRGLLEKSKVTQHAYEADLKLYWKEAKVMQEATQMVLAVHPISQPSLHLSHLDSYHRSRSQ
jgi:hypothetical protein